MITNTLLASLPVLAILVLMLGLRWSAARAGSIGLAFSLLIAVSVFGYGRSVLPELGVLGATGGGLLEAAFIAFTILWIVFPALCIHELQQASGAIQRLRDAIGSLSADPRITALLIAWFFSLFMEGAAGFGTAAALAAPFLVSMGFGRIEAVTIVLIGHSIGVSFGAVGTPLIPLAAVSPFTAFELSASVARYHALLGLFMTVMTMWFICRALPEQQRARGIWWWTLAAGLLFLIPYYLIAANLGPELPTLGGAILGASGFIALLLLARKQNNVTFTSNVRAGDNLWIAAAPYLILVALILITRLIPPLQSGLNDLLLQWRFHNFGGQMAYLYHPGTMLFLSFFLGAWFQRGLMKETRISEEVSRAMMRALKRLAPVSLALLAMLGLSRIMVHSGMIETLAIGAAASAGSAWPVFAPFVGVLGSFITGSATASNILFTEFQQTSAERLGLSVYALLGAQGFGAAVGNIVGPHNIIAASATVGLAGKEGDVLRRTIPVMLIYTLFGGLLALCLS